MATNINIPAPPSRTSKKGEPPAREETRKNLSKPDPSEVVPFNFRVPAGFKRDFKIACADYNLKQSELLQQAFEEWKKRHG